MEIKRESMDSPNIHYPPYLSFKKKRYRIEKGRLSIFITCGFLLLFLGLLTFEFRYLVLDNNATSKQSQSNHKDKYQNKDKQFSILKFFKEENSKKITSEPPKSAYKLDNSAIENLKNKFITFFSRKKETNILLKPTELVDSSQTPFFDKNKHKYSLQIMAIEEEAKTKALEITKKLVQEGYKAYTYKTPVKIISQSYPNGKYFYRIRIGFFQTRDEAKRIGDKIFQTNTSFPQDYLCLF